MAQAGQSTAAYVSDVKGQMVVRFIIAVLFWVGLFQTVREWIYARRHGAVITRAEKLCLVMALPLIFGAQLGLDLLGVAPAVATAGSGLAMGLALNVWAIKLRIRRTTSA